MKNFLVGVTLLISFPFWGPFYLLYTFYYICSYLGEELLKGIKRDK